MYRKLKRTAGEGLTSNRLVQVLENNTIADFPLIKKGVTLKNPIPNNYTKGQRASNKIDGDKIITVNENILHISKYVNGTLEELKSIELDIKNSNFYFSKIIVINNNECIIVYSAGSFNNGKIGCFRLYIDEEKGIESLSDMFIITSQTASNRIDVTALTQNKIAIVFIQRFIFPNSSNNKLKFHGKLIPVIAIINIKNGIFSKVQEPFIFEDFTDVEHIDAEDVYATKVSSEEFFVTYTFSSDHGENVISTIFKVDSQDAVHEYQSLKYKGFYNDWKVHTAKPMYLQDYRILSFEADKNDYNAVIRSIKQDNGVYSFSSVSSVKLKNYTPYINNVSLLRVNTDSSRDYMAFNQQIFNVNENNDKITLVTTVPKYTTEKASSFKLNELSTVNLDNNLMLAFNDDNDFQMVKYDEYDGQPLGIAKEQILTNRDNAYSVVVTGYAQNIDGVNFTAGENVYYDINGNLSHDNTGTYLGYATSSNSMIVRPDFIENPTIIRKYNAETPVNNKVVQIDRKTKLVSPLPLKQQGIIMSDVNSNFPSNSTKRFLYLKDNIFLCMYDDTATYKGYIQLYGYNSDNSATQLGVTASFFKNKVYGIREAIKIDENKLIIIFNDNDNTTTYTYAIGATIDYSNYSMVFTPPVQLDDYLNGSTENSYLYAISNDKAIHVYNEDNSTATGYTKAQVITLNSVDNTIAKTSSVFLQDNIDSQSKGRIFKLGNRYVFCIVGNKVVNSVNTSSLMTVVFEVGADNSIVKVNESILTNAYVYNSINCQEIDDSHFLVVYFIDNTYFLRLSIGTLHEDGSVTIGQRFLNVKGIYPFFDNKLVNNCLYFDDFNGNPKCVKYSIDLANDNITLTDIPMSGQIGYDYSSINRVGINKYICFTYGTVKKIISNETNYGGFYHNGYIYWSGYVKNVSDTIQNGVLYYWNDNGDYTTDSNSGLNKLLGVGLGNGIYILEKEEETIPDNFTYTLSVNVSPITTIKINLSKTITIQKYNNGVPVSGNFTFSIDYMGNATSIVSITASTSNTVTYKAGSTISKQFKMNCTDIDTGVVTSQTITTISAF